MREWINLTVLTVISLSFFLPNYSYAKGKEKEVEDLIDEKSAAFDCEALYILNENEISKHTLPSFSLVSSVDLPKGTKGKGIEIAGECGDPSETILVLVKRKGRKGGEAILSYSENLQLIGELSLLDDDDDEEDDDDNEDDDDDDDNDDNDDDD